MSGWGCRCLLGALGRQASGSAPHRPVARATASPGQGGQARLAHGLERLRGIMGPLCSWPARLSQVLPGPSGWWDWPLAPARSPAVLQMTLIFLSKECTCVLCLCTRAGAHSTPFLSRGSWDATGHRCGVERLVLVPAGRAPVFTHKQGENWTSSRSAHEMQCPRTLSELVPTMRNGGNHVFPFTFFPAVHGAHRSQTCALRRRCGMGSVHTAAVVLDGGWALGEEAKTQKRVQKGALRGLLI